VTDTAAELAPQTPRPVRSRRRWLPILIGLAVVVAVVALIWSLVGGSLFFYNADEAIERRDDLAGERFRVQGTPVAGSIVETFRGDEPVVSFSIAFEGAVMDVVHVGDRPDLFQEEVPVVLEGAWVATAPPVDDYVGTADDGWHFASDRMLAKHDNDYINDDEYDERITEAERGGLTGDEPEDT
jgi:cytochrome c-type biogenesis protein CcmE